VDAQVRIVRAVELAVSETLEHVHIAIVGHGGTRTLLYCHLAGVAIDRRYDQPATNGGNWFAFDRRAENFYVTVGSRSTQSQEKPREPAPVINLPAIRVLVTAAGERSVGTLPRIVRGQHLQPQRSRPHGIDHIRQARRPKGGGGGIRPRAHR